jgi:hypothetical protein
MSRERRYYEILSIWGELDGCIRLHAGLIFGPAGVEVAITKGFFVIDNSETWLKRAREIVPTGNDIQFGEMAVTRCRSCCPLSFRPGRLELRNENFAGNYPRTDGAYDKPSGKLAERKFNGISPELRSNLLDYPLPRRRQAPSG